jgi:hypothetical protein
MTSVLINLTGSSFLAATFDVSSTSACQLASKNDASRDDASKE